MKAPVTKYNQEESTEYMEKLAAGTVKDQYPPLMYAYAVLISVGMVIGSVLLCLFLLGVSVGVVQGAQYLCIKSGMCKGVF